MIPDITAPLQARSESIDFNKFVGKVSIQDGGVGGFYCDVCQCVIRDSVNFLDHKNSKMHIRLMGMSFRTKRSTLEEVKEALRAAKLKRQQKFEFNLEEQVKKIQEDEEEKKRVLKEIKRQKKLEKKNKMQKVDEPEDDEDYEELKRVMGFTSFGSSKK